MPRQAIPTVACIYIIKCKASGWWYVGSTNNYARRKRGHLNDLAAGSHHNRALQYAYEIHGADNLEFSELERCSILELKEKELEAMEYAAHMYGSLRSFNILKDARRPKSLSAEAREKLSEKAKQQHADGRLGRQTWRE